MTSPSRAASAVMMLLACGAGVAPAGAVEQFTPYRQSVPDGAYVDWLQGQAGILGRAVKYQDLTMKPFYLQAQQDALTDGRNKLLGFLRTVSIDGSRKIGDDAVLVGKVRALLEQIPAGDTQLSLPFRVSVRVKVPLFGERGILAAVLPEPPAKPSDVASPEAVVEAATETMPAEGPTGLIVDASALPDLTLALLPKILDEQGRVVHSLETADASVAFRSGVAAYALAVDVQVPSPAPDPREGQRPLRVKATGATGPGKASLVVSVADADRILKEAASSPFLKHCKVVILAPPARQGTPQTRPAPAPRKPATKPAPVKER